MYTLKMANGLISIVGVSIGRLFQTAINLQNKKYAALFHVILLALVSSFLILYLFFLSLYFRPYRLHAVETHPVKHLKHTK